MSERARFIGSIIFFIFCAVFIVYGLTIDESVSAESLENHCDYIGSVGNVAYGYCIDPNTGLEFIGSSNGYMEIIK